MLLEERLRRRHKLTTAARESVCTQPELSVRTLSPSAVAAVTMVTTAIDETSPVTMAKTAISATIIMIGREEVALIGGGNYDEQEVAAAIKML